MEQYQQPLAISPVLGISLGEDTRPGKTQPAFFYFLLVVFLTFPLL
jgi:hypothetical protein